MASQCWRRSLQCPPWLASLGRGDTLSSLQGLAELGRNFTYQFPRRGLICGASIGGTLCLVTLPVVLSQKRLGAPCFCQPGTALSGTHRKVCTPHGGA